MFPSVSASLQEGGNRISARIFIGQLFDKFHVLVFPSQCQDCAQKTHMHSSQQFELEDLSGKKSLVVQEDKKMNQFIIMFTSMSF